VASLEPSRLVVVLAAGFAVGCVGAVDGFDASGTAWSEGSQIFEDDRWLAGDGAVSVDLGENRTLWVFGDSFVAPEGERSREDAFFVSNTMAVQRGDDPANASMTFHWRTETVEDGSPVPAPTAGEDSRPSPILPDEEDGEIAHWPNHGTTIDGDLVLFFNRIERGEGQFGFEARGWTAFVVDNPYQRPVDWRFDEATTSNPFGDQLSVGAGSVFVHEDHLLAYAAREVPDGEFTRHEPHLFRYAVDDVLAGEMTEPEVYDPGRRAWVAQHELEQLPEPLFEPGAPGFTLHYDEEDDRWVQVQISGFPTGPVEVRTAPSPMGPFGEPVEAYVPPEAGIEDASTYLGHAHPNLRGAELVVGYSTNPLSDEAREQEPSLSEPRLVQLELRTDG